MNAETAYLFRHALVRDAAYGLQLPSDRARLHELAFLILEDTFGGRAPALAPLADDTSLAFDPHSTDVVARELAYHARLASDYQSESGMAEAHLLYLRRAAEVCEKSYQSNDAIRCWEKLGGRLDGVERGFAFHRGARVCGRSGNMENAERLFAAAEEVLKDTGHRAAQLAALAGLANVYRATERLSDAETTLLRVLEIRRELGDRKNEGATLNNLANIYHDTDRIDLAEQAFRDALAIAQEIGNRRSEGLTLGNLGVVYQTAGRLDDAESALNAALAIHREINNRASEGVALGNLADIYRHTDRLAEARLMFDNAIAIHREVGSRFFEAAHTGLVALLLLALDQREPAHNHWKQSGKMLQEMGATATIDRQHIEMIQTCERLGIEPFPKESRDEI